MQIAPKPSDEAARFDTLHSLSILDTPPEEHFDGLTRLARHHVVADLLASADHRMYEDKQRGKTAGT
ncbi:hypothetical protein [Burkholderia sp. NLJ2]|uniref:hypothetical protein n=1 Tax=Burkholderia sp. NLJ2 TaxID=3090699 RepID=UPI003C6BDCA8